MPYTPPYIPPYIPGLDNVPAKKSKVSSLDGGAGILAYRGYRIEELAMHSTFEEAAWLLIYGELPSPAILKKFSRSLQAAMTLPPEILKTLRSLPKNTHPMKALQVATAAIPVRKLDLAAFSREESIRKAINQQIIQFLGHTTALVSAFERIRNGKPVVKPKTNLGLAGNFYYQMFGTIPTEHEIKIVDACLVLHAEHTMNASTFATMVAGSTLAELPYVLATGIGTLAGPLHGGANERVINMLRKIPSTDKARSHIKDKLAKKEVIWGMGHREYSVKDPRAKVLQKLLVDFATARGGKPPKAFQIALEVESVCEELLSHKGVFPNVDFYSGILYRELKIPIDQYTPIFAISRTSGWIAHWLEQIASNKIFRPTQVYEGEALRPYPKA